MKQRRRFRVFSPAWTIVSNLDPTSHAAFIPEIFFAEFSLEIAFFSDNNKAIDQNKANWSGEQHPK